jgi:hypothetical protein
MRVIVCAMLLAGCASGLDGSVMNARLDADQLTIRVQYRDADGDLGGGVAEVQDCRAESLLTRLPLPPIASQEAVQKGVSIEGELELLVSHVSLVDPESPLPAICVGQDAPRRNQTAFCVILVDSAGNRSAIGCTGSLVIH